MGCLVRRDTVQPVMFFLQQTDAPKPLGWCEEAVQIRGAWRRAQVTGGANRKCYLTQQVCGLPSDWVWVWAPLLSMSKTTRCQTTIETHSSGSMCSNQSTCPCDSDDATGYLENHSGMMLPLIAINCALGLKGATHTPVQSGAKGSRRFTSMFVPLTSRWTSDVIVAIAAQLLPATGGRLEQMEGQMGQISEMQIPSSSSAPGSPTSTTLTGLVEDGGR